MSWYKIFQSLNKYKQLPKKQEEDTNIILTIQEDAEKLSSKQKAMKGTILSLLYIPLYLALMLNLEHSTYTIVYTIVSLRIFV